ncbi:MAG: enoyl-CoA hydratase/isomerase family protein [Rhodococcus sp. (in: high G+C Gram-positive bacteria)]|uniref:enoyl-CoA hydratase/isomerase family protein n=1 Tax=Rhodococcus sp. TaxID=1831 RepID=UPI003BB1B4DA
MTDSTTTTSPTTPVPRPPDGDFTGSPYLRLTREDSFAHLVVDRPEARNALTNAMYFGIRYASKRVDADPDLHGLLITGTGDVFIPGGDLGRRTPDSWMDFSVLGGDTLPFDTLRQSVKPVVCAINGICQGGGFMIALCSDVAVAAESATFRVPELFRGIADLYYAQMLPRIVGPVRTRDLMFTGRTLTAREAVDWGLIARVVPDEQLMDTATDVLRQCATTAPDARLQTKRVLDAHMGLYDRIGMAAGLRGDEFIEGWQAFSERRAPEWVPEDLRRPGRL